VQYVGIIVATWGLFQGASGIQLARQGFGEGHGHMTEFLFFFIMWGSEAVWIALVVFAGVGGGYDQYVANNPASIVIATLAMFALTSLTMIVQFLVWVFTCGKGQGSSKYQQVNKGF
jgi:hypothetical protein